ncbi:hypothetical protein GOODEAATRI_016900, partial [Goodea atripinnis]
LCCILHGLSARGTFRLWTRVNYVLPILKRVSEEELNPTVKWSTSNCYLLRVRGEAQTFENTLQGGDERAAALVFISRRGLKRIQKATTGGTRPGQQATPCGATGTFFSVSVKDSSLICCRGGELISICCNIHRHASFSSRKNMTLLCHSKSCRRVTMAVISGRQERCSFALIGPLSELMNTVHKQRATNQMKVFIHLLRLWCRACRPCCRAKTCSQIQNAVNGELVGRAIKGKTTATLGALAQDPSDEAGTPSSHEWVTQRPTSVTLKHETSQTLRQKVWIRELLPESENDRDKHR